MRVSFGEKAVEKSYQAPFPLETECVHCLNQDKPGHVELAQLAFVAHEGLEGAIPPGSKIEATDDHPGGVFAEARDLNGDPFVCQLHETTGQPGGLWLHDCCAVAIYFCRCCLKPTALYNQG